MWLLAIIAAGSFAPKAWSQMMGGSMGSMMGGGNMQAMEELMSWMHGENVPTVPTKPKPEFNAELRATGEALYLHHCAVCHGPNGDGEGSRASELSPRPRDFTRSIYEFRSTPSGALPVDEDIWQVISSGLHGTAMVPWISLSERQRWALVAYLEAFSPKFASEKRGTPIEIPPPPAVTPQLIA